MINIKKSSGVLFIILVFAVYITGCSTFTLTNYYNFEDVSEDNSAFILVSPISMIDGVSEWPFINLVKINGYGDRDEWKRPVTISPFHFERAVVRVSPGEYTFTITFVRSVTTVNLRSGLNETTRREIPVSVNCNVEAGKGYTFWFTTRRAGGDPTSPTTAEIIIKESDVDEKGNFHYLFQGFYKEAAKKTETFYVTNQDMNIRLTTPSFNNDAGDLAGTWRGIVMNNTAIVVISNSGWRLNIPGLSYEDFGSFNRNGNSANLYSIKFGMNVGNANIINNTQIQVIMNSNTAAPGSYLMTR